MQNINGIGLTAAETCLIRPNPVYAIFSFLPNEAPPTDRVSCVFFLGFSIFLSIPCLAT